MDLSPFKQDIDELIRDFDEGDVKSLSDMKRIWLAKQFSCIFDAVPASANLALFMQSLYAHCFGHMVADYSMLHRLGGLFCLYCFYEIQPFKPPFKIYLSRAELRRLKALVVDGKKEGTRVVSTLVRRMLERNAFLFGYVDMDESDADTLQISKHEAMLQKLREKLFADCDIEQFLHVDMGTELDLGTLQKNSTEYAEAKSLLLKEANGSVHVQDINHIGENSSSIGDQVGKIVENWNLQKDLFYQQTGLKKKSHKNEDSRQLDTLQQLGDEGLLEDEDSGFMQLLNGEQDLSYADDLEILLSDDTAS